MNPLTRLFGLAFLRFFVGVCVIFLLEYLQYAVTQEPSIPYTSGVPSSSTSPLLAGVCSLRNGNPCVPEAICRPSVPIVGEAICQCPKGYAGDGKRPPQGQGCANIDECAIGAHDCTERNMDCIDLPGSFRCECKSGYELAPNKNFCVDIDECSGPNMNKCDGVTTVCFNLEGSYECRCKEDAMILDDLTGFCRDLNECEDKGGVFNACDQICTDKNPGFECSCREGWELAEDGQRCLDIDECTLGTDTCSIYGDGGAQCKNTLGSYECVCSTEKGWVANPRNAQVCDNLNECKTHPYICGGPDSCCGDLMPPEKFACMMPVSPSVLASINPTFNPNGVTFGGNSSSSTLGSPINGFNNGSITRAPVGPAAATLTALAQAAQRHNSDIANGSAQGISALTVPRGCFEENVEYVGKNILGTPTVAESESVCHSSCQKDPVCEYFSFNRSTNNCFLKTSGTERTPNKTFVSGPKLCARVSSQWYLANSQQMTPLPVNGMQLSPRKIEGLNQQSEDIYNINANEISNEQNTRDGFHVVENIIDNVRTVLPKVSTIYDNEATDANVGPSNVVGSFLERFSIPTAQNVNFAALSSVFPADSVLKGMSVDSLESSHADSLLDHLALESLQNSDDYIIVIAADKSYDGVMEELKTKLQEKLSNGNYTNRRLQVFSSFQNARGILRGRLPNLTNVVPRFSDRGLQCPNGFNNGQELYRARVREQAVTTLQRAVAGSVNSDGTVVQGISPSAFTDAIVKNSSLLAQKMTAWYNELATVPGELVTAGTSISQALDFSPVLNAKAEALGTNPAAIAAASAIGTGLVVGGIADAVYGGGPGDSKVLDRTGISKKMAYGLM